MATQHPAQPSQWPPYVEKSVLGPRFWAKTRREANGCLRWTGGKCARIQSRPDEGQIRVRAGFKDYRVLSASRVAWWLAGNDWPQAYAQLRHTCGARDCVEHSHLQKVTLAARSKIDAATRKQIKDLYAVRVARYREVYGKLGVTRMPSALSLTEKRMWVSRDTVERFLRGQRMSPAHWHAHDASVDELKATYEAAKRDADSIRARLQEVEPYSIRSLALKFGVAQSAIGRALYADD